MMVTKNRNRWLPTSKKEVDVLGWEQLDIILFSGDAYVDHPSFGIAAIGRILERNGYKVAIVPQPNWRDDLRDFKKLGTPRLFFGVSSGAMDSMDEHPSAPFQPFFLDFQVVHSPCELQIILPENRQVKTPSNYFGLKAVYPPRKRLHL